MSFSILQLGPVIQTFLERFPGVTVELNMDDRQVDLVEEGYDVAIRIGRLHDSNLVARKITPCRQVIRVLSPKRAVGVNDFLRRGVV